MTKNHTLYTKKDSIFKKKLTFTEAKELGFRSFRFSGFRGGRETREAGAGSL